MKVEVWSDYMCPFCYIGKRRFEAALDQFANNNEIEVSHRSFELDPNAKRDVDFDIHDMLASKYGMSREQAIAMNDDVSKQARSAGLTFHFDTMIPTNTLDAHRLTLFAAKLGKMNEMAERLFQAHFAESKHLGDLEALASLAEEAGLDKNEVAAMLAGNEYTAEVRAEEQEASSLGIPGVPFFVVNRKYAVSGAQSSEVFLEALQKAWDESRPFIIAKDSSAQEGCADGTCTTSEHK